MDPITALLVIAAGIGSKYVSERQATKQRDQLRQAMEAYQRTRASESTAATENLISQQTPAKRAAELSAVTDDRARSLEKTVSAAQATEAAPIAGKLSSDYTAAQERAANTVAARTKRAIEQLATIGAPGEQQLKSSMRYGRAAGVVDAANRGSEYVGNAYMRDINNVRPNPLLTMAGDAALAVGGYGLGGAAGARAAPAGASAMGADPSGSFTYEDSAGNLQSSSMPYRRRIGSAFSLWGK